MDQIKKIHKHKTLIISSIVLLSIFVLIYVYNGSFKINNVNISDLVKVGKRKTSNPLNDNKVVMTDIHMGVGGDNSVGIELATPYQNAKQLSQLSKYSMNIKNDFLMSVGQKKLKKWVTERNFTAIKSTFLNIVNKYVDEPIDDVYINRFFYE